MSTFKPHSHVPYGQDGSGLYSDNEQVCYDAIAIGTPMVLNATENIKFEKGDRPFVICDYGTADGGTSMFLMKDVIKYIKSRYGDDQSVHVFYEDQPVNDFKSLFLRIHGLIEGPPSYLMDYKEVYTAACGTGFYDQCLPSGSLNLGFTFVAVHWLSKRPCCLSDTISHLRSKVPGEKEKFKQQAAKDWETFLLQRAKELAHGGQMVVGSLAIDSKGQHLGKTDGAPMSIFEIMETLWKDMVKEGTITQEEFINTTFNNYNRTVEEFKAPFQDAESGVVKAGLRLITTETKTIRCPELKAFKMAGKQDANEASKAYAKRLIMCIRMWSNSTFIAGLSDERTDTEKRKIVDEFYQRYENLVIQNPGDHCMDLVMVYLQMEKL